MRTASHPRTVPAPRRRWALAALLALAGGAAGGLAGPGRALAGDLQPGSGSFAMPARPDGSGTLAVLYHKPAGLGPDRPVVFVLHGVGRGAEAARDAWTRHAERCRFLLVLPRFATELYGRGRDYQQGGMVDGDGRLRPRPDWTFFVVDRVFDRLRALGATRRDRFSLYGHSAGAQFVHRYVAFAAGARLERAVVANAGWYTLPDRTQPYPYGLAGVPLDDDGLRRMLARRVVVLLGEADTDPAGPDLRRSAAADRQGPHRLARGRTYFQAAEALAGRLGTPFNWSLRTVPGVGHANRGMADAAAEHLCDGT